MADSSVPITAGTGTNIDTQVPTGGDHRQVVVLGDPTTIGGVAPVDGTLGLKVDVARVIPGTTGTSIAKAEDAVHVDGDTGVMMLGVRNHYSGSTTDGDYAALSVSSYGDLHTISRREMVKISVQSAGLTNVTYAAGDQVGNLFTITNAARITGGSGNIVGVVLVDAQDVIGPMDVVFFDASVTLAADNAAFSISDADALNISALVQLAGAIDIGGNRIATGQNLSIPFVCGAASQNIYAALITRFANSGFPSAGLLQLIVYIERN